MALDVYTAALLAAVAWGIDPILSKRGLAYGGTPGQVAVLVVGVRAVTFWSALFVLYGPSRMFVGLTAIGVVVFLAGGFIPTVVGRLGYYTGVDRVGASISTAGTSTHPVFATILALVFLRELITTSQALGIVVVVCGLAVLSISKGGDITGWPLRDLVFPLTAAAVFGLGQVIRRFGLLTTPATPLEATALNDAAAFVGLVGYLLVTREQGGITGLPLRGYVYFIGAGVMSALGLFLLFIGLNAGPVAVASTLVATSALFATAFSALVLRDLERVTRGVVAGAVLVVVGVGLIALAP